MKTKLYLKGLLTLAIVPILSTNINAQKSEPLGPKSIESRVPTNVHSHVKPNPHAGGDSLYLDVHAPLSEVFTLTITDTADAVVNTLSVNGGENLLPFLPIGRYSYTLANAEGNIVSKGKLDVKAPHVHSHVKPNPHAGEIRFTLLYTHLYLKSLR
ncbi:MAG: hypothetical protein NVV82_22340 [Sporocytophaga sp.]|nr:hypothetical protein [Sporocytophaga sp.]